MSAPSHKSSNCVGLKIWKISYGYGDLYIIANTSFVSESLLTWPQEFQGAKIVPERDKNMGLSLFLNF